MDNRRNSGSYSSRVANPPPQPVPDSYHQQKRSSYRRPVEPQPASTPGEATGMTANVSSNSARPVAFGPPPNGVSRGSSHRRRQSQQIPPPPMGGGEDAMPTAPDVPRGPPPTSYRDPYAPKSSRSNNPSRSHSGRSRDPTIYSNASRQQPTVQVPPQRLQELRDAPFSPTEPLSATAEFSRRDSQSRRPSVPDRSPLQKLEGKLDDISKEERRARILEAELAAQEKAEAERAARRAREAAAKQQRNVSGPMPGSERAGTAPNRATSTKRHVSMPTRNIPKSPDFSGDDGPLHDLSEPWDPASGQYDRHFDTRAAPSASQRQKNRLSYNEGAIGRTPSTKGEEPVGASRGPTFADRSAPARRFDGEHGLQPVERKPVPPQGLGLYGLDEGPSASRQANVGRYDSTRLSKDLPPTPKSAAASADVKPRDSRGILAAQKEMEQQRLDNKRHSGGLGPLAPQHSAHTPETLGTRDSRYGLASNATDPQLPHAQDDPQRHHFRDVWGQHDPDRRYEPAPMLEEWKTATIASLAANDLDLDAPERSDSTKKAWWEESTSSRRRRSGSYAQPTYDGYADEPSGQTSFNPPLYLKCGPLLRYTGIRGDKSKPGKPREIWRGSVMIVTEDQQSSYDRPPTLRLFKQHMDLLPPPPLEVDAEGSNHLNPAYVDPIEGQTKVSRSGKTLYVKPIEDVVEGEDLSRIEDDTGLFQATRVTSDTNGAASAPRSSRVRKRDGEKLGKFREIPGVRLHAERGYTFWRFNLEIELGSLQTRIAYRINRGPAIGFWVPAKGETMNMMFHSCNGFSLSVDPKEFCGPDPLWRDVLNQHQTRPFHVMIGGGDQIYNDAAMRQTTLFRQWTESRNPMQKHSTPFSAALQDELEQFYLDRYAMWFSQGLFGMANSQIPMINIWDDHDIIDGYGSYPHHFMETAVFTGLGAVAFKYYMLFQHQSVISETEKTEPSWLLGANPGPYIHERSRSVFMSLGQKVAFLGLDCRTERQRDEIISEDSYDLIFDRLEAEIVKGETKHLIVLLGVPIAYPRLNFLENVLTSRLMDPIKALGRTGMLGGFVNKFDGGVEILDDLDDHWTAKHHKEERNWFIRELQHIASTKSVRVTILGGDVHLAAVGQFFTNKKANIPKDRDHRYMPNIVSSAIVNTPPPEMMADIINKRNKIHHLDAHTDENMIPLFTHDVDGKKRNNNHLLPRRNWCSLREYHPGTTPPHTPSPPATASGDPEDEPRLTRTLSDFTPGKMVRRLSGGGRAGGRTGRASGPPMAYYNNPNYAAADEAEAQAHQSRFSFSPEREQPRSRRNSLTSLFRRRGSTDRRASLDSSAPPGSAHSMPAPHGGRPSVSQERPTAFHRRPSVLSKKGIQKQGDYINLEGGLDICLNLEVSQKDPAGITTPYRLLVPALHYVAPATDVDAAEPERRKSRGVGGLFRRFSTSRKKATVGDDGYSLSGSDADVHSEHSSDLGEIDEEEEARRRYKVGPRILIPGISKRRPSESGGKAPANAAPVNTGPRTRTSISSGPVTSRDINGGGASATPAGGPITPASRTVNGSRSDYGTGSSGSRAYGSATAAAAAQATVTAAHRRASGSGAPLTSGFHTNTASSTVQSGYQSRDPTHVNTLANSNPNPSPAPAPTRQLLSNSSHNATLPLPPEPKGQRLSMGGILNQHRGERWENDAHVNAHTPSTRQTQAPQHGKQKRESYPPHPAIVGAGPNSPYARGSDRNGGGAAAGQEGYFASGGRSGAPNAGVGARYLGGGRYADEEDDDEYSDEEGYSDDGRRGAPRDEDEFSDDSFVPPKRKSKWKIWK